MSEKYADDNRALGRAATNRFVNAALPPHGRHAGQHDPATTVRGGDGGSIIVPSRTNPSAERVTNVYEAKIARNGAEGNLRKGRVQAAEGITSRDPAVEQMFREGFAYGRAQSASNHWVESKIANGRSGLADGHDSGNPTWASANDPIIAFDFAGTARTYTEPQRNVIRALGERSTPATHTDLSRLDLRERPGNQFGRVLGNDRKQVRPNEAEVVD